MSVTVWFLFAALVLIIIGIAVAIPYGPISIPFFIFAFGALMTSLWLVDDNRAATEGYFFEECTSKGGTVITNDDTQRLCIKSPEIITIDIPKGL